MQASITTRRTGRSSLFSTRKRHASRSRASSSQRAFMRRSLHWHGSWSSNCRSRRVEL